MAWPERKLESVGEFMKKFPSALEVMIDGTERPIQPPKEQQKQKNHDSHSKSVILLNIELWQTRIKEF